MGKVLQIRVVAETWNDKLVEEYWPRLAQLAFETPIKFSNQGILELVRGLAEGLEFLNWSARRKEAMGPDIRRAARIKADLEKALADWEPRKANSLSDELEDVLDELERKWTA